MNKENYVTSWKKMPIEDKMLLIIESICYLLSIGTLMAIIFVINRGSMFAAYLLIIGIIGLIGCGLSARRSRDAYLGDWKFSLKINKKDTKMLKLN